MESVQVKFKARETTGALQTIFLEVIGTMLCCACARTFLTVIVSCMRLMFSPVPIPRIGHCYVYKQCLKYFYRCQIGSALLTMYTSMCINKRIKPNTHRELNKRHLRPDKFSWKGRHYTRTPYRCKREPTIAMKS